MYKIKYLLTTLTVISYNTFCLENAGLAKVLEEASYCPYNSFDGPLEDFFYRSLISAIGTNNLQVIEKMLKNPKYSEQINTKNEDGKTPLIFAILIGNSEVVKALMNNGADASIKDKFGKTAYDYAKDKQITLSSK